MESEKIKYAIPLLGVVLGWILNSLHGYFSALNSNRKLLSKCIVQLEIIYREQRKLIMYFDFLKDSIGVPQEYEDLRKNAMLKYIFNNDDYQKSKELVLDVSSLYLILGLNLKSLIDNYSFSQSVSFEAIRDDNNLYLKVLSIFETTFELNNSELGKLILKLAFKKGIFTWLRFKRIRNKLIKGQNNLISSELVRGLSDDFKTNFNNPVS